MFRGWSGSTRADCTTVLENSGVFRQSLSLSREFPPRKAEVRNLKTLFGKHRLEPFGGRWAGTGPGLDTLQTKSAKVTCVMMGRNIQGINMSGYNSKELW